MLLNGMEEVITGFKPRPPESLVCMVLESWSSLRLVFLYVLLKFMHFECQLYNEEYNYDDLKISLKFFMIQDPGVLLPQQSNASDQTVTDI